MSVKANDYARFLYNEAGEAKIETRELVDGFFDLLKTNGDVGKTEAIIKEFEKEYYKQNKILKAEVVSARPVSEETKEAIKKELLKAKPEMREVELAFEIDPTLLAGMKIFFDGMLLDGSAKKQLANLKAELAK